MYSRRRFIRNGLAVGAGATLPFQILSAVETDFEFRPESPLIPAPHEPAAWPEGVIRHGHVPLSTLTEHLQRMHLMVFPTFFEGSSLVVYQALALGLPVITTNNCGSVVDETCGQILPDVSARAVEHALEAVRLDPARLTAWRQGATARANGFTWTAYGDHLATILRRLDPELA